VSQQGISPYEAQYLDKPNSTTLAKGPTRWATLIPTLYNADTLGVRPDLVN
jgi:putative spermidine/putrescine transport system substrate-binding protein